MNDDSLRYKVIIKGAYGSFNFGDDALMLAIDGLLKSVYANDEIAYYCNYKEYLHELIPGLKVIQPGSATTLMADLCLYGGGTQFYSFSSNRLKTAKAMVKDYLRPLYRIMYDRYRKISHRHNVYNAEKYKYIAAIGIGMGPFSDTYSMNKISDLIRKMGFVAVRDEKSYRMCMRHGIEKAALYTDLCYWPQFVTQYIKTKKETTYGNVRRVGFIVRDWQHDEKGNSYADNLLMVVEWLKKRSIDVEFILFAGFKDKGWIGRLGTNNLRYVSWNPDVDSVESFLDYMSGFDMFLTSRFHGGVFASLLSKPCICIGIEQKLEMFAEVLGEGGRLWKYPFRVNDCIDLIDDICTNFLQTIHALKSSVDQQKKLAQIMVDDFFDFCFSKPVIKIQSGKRKSYNR